jgi:hypothetical protein
MTKKARQVRFDLITASILLELLWGYALWGWLSVVIDSWVFDSFWSYYGAAFIFLLFVIVEYLVFCVFRSGMTKKPLIPYRIVITVKRKKS